MLYNKNFTLIPDVKDERISRAKKDANKKQWYKDKADALDAAYMGHASAGYSGGKVSAYENMKVNYNLYNNILDTAYFDYVCSPYGKDLGTLPAKMVNRDIISNKIRAVIGMESKRPYIWKAVATNPEATTRKEEKEFSMIRDYVVDQIMTPIRQEVEMRHQQEMKGRELTPQEQQEIQQKVEQETQSMTPEEVKKYMARVHQDPAEIMSNQLLEYLHQKCGLKRKFSKALKHGLISGMQVMYVGVFNGEPDVWNVNSLNFKVDGSPDLDFIEDGDSATCEYRMTPAEIVQYFGDELKDDEIDRVYSACASRAYRRPNGEPDMFAMSEADIRGYDNTTLSVVHAVWKGLREIGLLQYLDPQTGELKEMIVDENYKKNEDAGDISIEWEWVLECYETWKIRTPEAIYLRMRPVPGQFKDINNMHHCKLPYHGVIYDNMNARGVSMMDRVKDLQYYYNILLYRLELLTAADKGKKLLMNVAAIPRSEGITTEQWMQHLEAMPVVLYNPQEEGAALQDSKQVASVLDMSMGTDVKKYMELAEYVRQQAGRCIGVPDEVEGQIETNDAVGNTQEALRRTSTILQTYFDMHDHFKRNVLQTLIETAKVAYHGENTKKISYVLDDHTQHILEVDMGLIDNSTLGIFMSNSAKLEDAKQMLNQLAQAAMQSQKLEFSDIIKILITEDLTTATETLKLAEQKRRDFEQQMQQQQIDAQKEQQAAKTEELKMQHEFDMELTKLKEEERRETEIQKLAITGMSFNPGVDATTDADNDGTNDFLEILRHGKDAEIEKAKLDLDRQKQAHTQNMDRIKSKQEDEKIKNEREKIKVQARQKAKTKS